MIPTNRDIALLLAHRIICHRKDFSVAGIHRACAAVLSAFVEIGLPEPISFNECIQSVAACYSIMRDVDRFGE